MTRKFGDVVFEPKETVKNPVAEGIEHVVGLEHIVSEDMHLRQSANVEKSTTFTKKFSKGDVLFGRRRAYLKKAAKAEFEGICSGDITVMRSKENLIPSLLPFIVNNDRFFDFAITHSAGGLSPRVKFKDLSKYEIKIPEGYVLTVLPPEKELKTKFGTYKVNFKKINDSTFKYHKTIAIKEGVYPKEDYKLYRSFRRSIAKYENLRIAITKK